VPYIEDVHAQEDSRKGTPPLDGERGRRDDRSQLRLRLADAPNEYVEGALDNPELGPDELAILLRNRQTTTAIVARVGRNRSWMRSRALKIAFVSNPRAPQVLARRFLPQLSWRDLAKLVANLRVSPVLRRESEKLIRTRLPELSTGEKVALARLGSRGIVEMLRDETDGLVLRALAGNTRATEADLAGMVSRKDAPPSFLRWLADESSWGQRREVRLALIRHPRTPPSSALRLTLALSPRDVDLLRRDPAAPRIVRVAAERRLASYGAGQVGRRPHFG
jgi:hypothetical protein